MKRCFYKNEKNTKINQNIKYKGLKYNYKQLMKENSEYVENANKISVRPNKKICDITGLVANYICPRTGLYYYDLSVYEYIRDLKIETAQNYIALRNFARNLYSFQKDY
ncbi:hypothetical protein BDAP_001207 [Binucleata daphniae]